MGATQRCSGPRRALIVSDGENVNAPATLLHEQIDATAVCKRKTERQAPRDRLAPRRCRRRGINRSRGTRPVGDGASKLALRGHGIRRRNARAR
jgi:hypothetical protein